MSDKLVSLSKFRKARERAEKRAKADENAVKFGRTKAQKTRDEADSAKITKLWEDHQRDTPED